MFCAYRFFSPIAIYFGVVVMGLRCRCRLVQKAGYLRIPKLTAYRAENACNGTLGAAADGFPCILFIIRHVGFGELL